MISVIIPTSSPKKYLQECLDSLDRQTLDKKFYEVIIVLNGVKEPYYERLSELLKNYSFIYRLYYTCEKGVSNARNIGIEETKAEYICFVDDDDVVSDNYLQELYANVRPDTLVVSNVLAFHDISNMKEQDYLSKAFLKRSHPKSIFFSRKFFSTVWGKVIPRKIIDSSRFNAKFNLGEDALFMASLSCKIQYIIKTKQDAIYYRRLREGSASRKKYRRVEVILNKINLINAYVRMYLSQKGYSLVFFISRVVAVILK